MTQDPRDPRERLEPLDDSQIARLVHDVADGWTMPPVRLDAPAWRERVRSRRARRLEEASGWLARVGRATSAAVALTVVAALVAIIVTRPPQDPGTSPDASDRSSPGATDGANPSPLPRLLVEGDLPAPSRIVVQGEPDFAIVDLEKGTIGAPITNASFGSALQVRTDGTLVCLCFTESGSAEGNPTTVAVNVERFTADGNPSSTVEVRTFTGQADPRDGTGILPDRPPNVLTWLGFSEADRYGFVGWSRRVHPFWESGLLVVDLREGTVVSELALPSMTSGDDSSRRVVTAPRVVGSAGDRLVIGRSWYEFTPPESTSPSYIAGTEAFAAGYPGGVLADLAEVPGMAGCGDTVLHGGLLADGGVWVACSSGGAASTRLRRVTGEGLALPDVSVAGEGAIEGDATAVDRDGTGLYVWNAASATLTRVDTSTGEVRTGQGRTARADGGLLTTLGRWLAPVAAAKTELTSAVLVDGARVYAIGVRGDVGGPEPSGSAGVFVFDAETLAPLDVYEPTADFVSLAISADGRFLFAAGLPRVDALGRPISGQGASITVFDTVDGSTRLIAGQLGGERLAFGRDPLR